MKEGYPSIVVRTNSRKAAGFAFLCPFLSAETFTRMAEIAYFILLEHTRLELGSKILRLFVEETRPIDADNRTDNISSRNQASPDFHKKQDFVECGRFCDVGKKFGEDFDVVWMQKKI